VVAVLVVFLAGFVTVLAQRGPGGRNIAVDERDGLPPGVALTDESGGAVRDDGMVEVWAGGSSSCPWVPVGVELAGGTLEVTLETDSPLGGACTADVAFRTYTIRPPQPLEDGVDVELVFADPG
jgi:hypothetical protein